MLFRSVEVRFFAATEGSSARASLTTTPHAPTSASATPTPRTILDALVLTKPNESTRGTVDSAGEVENDAIS